VTQMTVQRTVDDNGVVHSHTVTTTAPATGSEAEAIMKKTTETTTTSRQARLP